MNETKNSNGTFRKNGSKKNTRPPLSKAYFSLGEGKGVKVAVWPNSMTLERTEKLDGKWQTTQEFHLAYKIIKEIAWRATHWLQEMDNAMENEKGK